MRRITITLSFLLLFSLILTGQSKEILNNVLTVAVYHSETSYIPLGYGEANLSKKTRALKKKLKADVIGTGFIYHYKSKPYLITCAHVIDASNLKSGNIKAYDRYENEYKMKLVGGDTFYDIAVLSFEESNNTKQFTGLKFGAGKKDLNIWTIGAAAEIVKGVILKEMVFVNSEKYISKHNRYLKANTEVTPGFSGGPVLYNTTVVGINTSRNTKTKVAYSLQGQYAKKYIEQIITNKGRIQRRFFGFEIKQSKFENELPFIAGTIPNSPAAKYSKYRNYSIVKVNNRKTKNIFNILHQLEKVNAGEIVTLQLKKGKNKPIIIKITPKSLDEKALESIANYVFKEHSIYQLRKLENSEEKTSSSVGFRNKTTKKSDFDTPEVLKAMGIGGDYRKIYQVKTLKDVGVIIRICGLLGEPISCKTKRQYKYENAIQPPVKKFFLSPKGFQFQVLYY